MKLLLIIILFFNASFAKAQSLFNKSLISISSSGVLYVKDTIVNNGTIINNGDMQVGGSWINNNQYDAGHGKITFNSDLPQLINHNDQSFSRLTISGGGTKLIGADITIEGELVLTEGIIETENNSSVFINSDAVVTGGSDQSHIHAQVYHQGSGEKIFPIGNGTLYLPVILENVEDPSAVVGVEMIEDGTPLLKAPSLAQISNTRYWRVDVAEGTLNSRIILPIRDEPLFTNLDDIVVAQSSSLTQNFEGIGQSAAEGTVTNGMVTSNDFVNTPFVALATVNADGPIVVYNAISPNNDPLSRNEFLTIGNIENYPGNTFSLFNRWGDKVFEIQNYNNKDRIFLGKSNINDEKDLVNGTYYYVIETESGLKVNGFLSLKR
jgi:gliding motility-associated-like protein